MEKRKPLFGKRLNVGQLFERWETEHPNSLPYEQKHFQQEIEETAFSVSGLTIKVFTTMGAWLAAIMFMAVLGLAGIVRTEESALVAGIIFTAIYLISSYIGTLKASYEAFTLALGLIGQGLLFFGLLSVFRFENLLLFAIICMVIEAVIMVLTFSQIQRFISTVLIFLSSLGVCHELGFYNGPHFVVGILSFVLAYFWINEAKIISQDQRLASYLNPVGMGLTISIVLLLALSVNRKEYQAYIGYWWISGAFMVGAILYVVRSMLNRYGGLSYQWLAYVSIVIMLGPTVLSPGIAAGIFFLLLGFYRGHYLISGLGTTALIIFTFMFYYNLELDYIQKSSMLAIVGMVFLFVRLALNRLVLKHDRLEQQFTEENDSTT